jgi:hypothetical protein
VRPKGGRAKYHSSGNATVRVNDWIGTVTYRGVDLA